MTRGRVGLLIAVAMGPLGWCLALGTSVGGDPFIAVEVVGGGLILLWTVLLAGEVIASHRLARSFDMDSEYVALFGVPCRVTPALGTDALVVGTLRPRILLGRSLLSALTLEELEAVVYHEDHHRRTGAPIRAAALTAWLRLLGRSGRVRRMVSDRLADLESLADADAIRRGSSPRALARALLKGDLSRQPVALTYEADRRVERLLDAAAGVPVRASTRLPYEWLPVAVLVAATLVCHAIL